MQRRSCYWAGLLCGTLAVFLYGPVLAAPPTIGSAEHPFDSDWPDVYLILAAKCVGCHRPGTDRANFTSYDSLVAARSDGGKPVAVPGDPEASLLWQKVRWNHGEDPASDAPDAPEMPFEPAEWLTGGQQATLRRWIENGAREYAQPDCCSPRRLIEIDFPSAKECRACHPRQYEQWSRSMHAYAQHSPAFEAFNLTMIERTAGSIDTFCSRCHTPLGTALGENGSLRNVHRSRLSMEGVTCVVCHRLATSHYKANTRRVLVPGKLLETCMYGPFVDPVSADVEAHASAGRAHLKSSAFCGACHDVTSPQGVRLEEAYSEWQNSPAARQQITCQQCHMGPVQGVPIPDDQRPFGRAASVPGVPKEKIPLRRLSDHTFAGPDYSLLPDTEFPEKLDWMYETDYRRVSELTSHQRETLWRLRRRNRRQLKAARAKRYELLGNAAAISVRAPNEATTDSRISVRVNVTSKVAGHNFPTGFTAERQAWVEVTLLDPYGVPVFQSGDVDANGDLRDEHSHAVESGQIPYDRHLLNFQSKFVALTNRGTERTVILPVNRHPMPLTMMRPAFGVPASFGRPPDFRVAKGSLPPLATAGQTYSIRIPDCPGEYTLRVRLNFRHLPPALFDQIGIGHLKHLLETVVIDEQTRRLFVSPRRGHRP